MPFGIQLHRSFEAVYKEFLYLDQTNLIFEWFVNAIRVFCEVFTQIYDSQFESKQLATSILPGHISSRLQESTATYYTDSKTSLYTAPHHNNNIRLDLETL